MDEHHLVQAAVGPVAHEVGLKVKLGEELDSMAKFLPTFKNARGNDDRYFCSGPEASPLQEDQSVPGVTGSRSTKAACPGRRTRTSASDAVPGRVA